MNFEHTEFPINGVSLKGLKITGEKITERNIAHTIILLDTSGSMNEDNKLNIVKKSLYFLLRFFQSTDSLSLITFNETSNIIIEDKNATPENLNIFNYTIDRLSANGGTNLSAGLLNVKSILQRNIRSTKTGLIILTDGHTNEGLTKQTDLVRIIESIHSIQSNISITTIGYGETHNAILLKELAVVGNGSYNIVNNPEEVGTVFGDVLGGLISCVAQNVQVAYSCTWDCLNSYKKNLVNDTFIMNIGDIYSESEIVLIFENTDTKSVQIQGIDARSFQILQQQIQWPLQTTSISIESYVIAYLRSMIANILTIMSNNYEHRIILNTIASLNTILQYPYLQRNPLTQIMKDELESISLQIRTNNYMNTSQNIQHSAFYGLGRGVRTPQRSQEDDLITGISNISIQTPYSNEAQRNISLAMTQLTQDPST